MARYTYYKILVENWLRGSIRNESPTVRGIWTDVLALAADTTYGEDGIVCLAPGLGLTDKQIAIFLNLEDGIWLEAKERLIKSGRITVQQPGNVITVVNWTFYQSDYSRQKISNDPHYQKLKTFLVKRDGRFCQECNKKEMDLKLPLCFDYLDGNSANRDAENIQLVCIRCRALRIKERQRSPTIGEGPDERVVAPSTDDPELNEIMVCWEKTWPDQTKIFGRAGFRRAQEYFGVFYTHGWTKDRIKRAIRSGSSGAPWEILPGRLLKGKKRSFVQRRLQQLTEVKNGDKGRDHKGASKARG